MDSLATPEDLTNFESGDPQSILDQVSGAVRSYCGWSIAPPETVTLKIDGSGGRHLWLPTMKLTEVSAVSNGTETLDDSAYDWSESGYLELRSGRWSSRPRGVEVTMTHGYEDTPTDVLGVIVGIAERVVTSPSGMVASHGAGPFSVSYIANGGMAGGFSVMAHEYAILNHHKLPPRA